MSLGNKQNAVVSLKYPSFVEGVGQFRTFEGETLAGGDPFKVRLIRVRDTKGRWRESGAILSFSESCVVSRQYVDKRPEQTVLDLLGAGQKGR